MSLIRDLAKELFKMFLADLRLTAATLALVAAVAAGMRWAGLAPLWAGALLVTGCLAILVEAALRRKGS